MNYTSDIISVNPPKVNVCEVGAYGKPGGVVRVLLGQEAQDFLDELQKEIDEFKG